MEPLDENLIPRYCFLPELPYHLFLLEVCDSEDPLSTLVPFDFIAICPIAHFLSRFLFPQVLDPVTAHMPRSDHSIILPFFTYDLQHTRLHGGMP